jgi:hypothetical protein
MVTNPFDTLTFMMALSPTFPFGLLPTGIEFLMFEIMLSDGLLAKTGWWFKHDKSSPLPDGI